MDVLVVGGSRFLGLHVVMALQEEGHQVTTLNRGTLNQPANVRHLKCDRKDRPRTKKMLDREDFDAVIDISISASEDTRQMIELFEGRIDRFVHCSTGAVYEDRWEYPVLEDDPTIAWTGGGTYPEEKAECERLLTDAYMQKGFPIVILRPTVIYGPHNYVYREAYVFDRAEADRPIPVPGDGKSVTHVVHVDDVAKAFVSSLSFKTCIGQVYNIAGPRAVTLDRWAEAAAKPVVDLPKILHYDQNLHKQTQEQGFPLSVSPWVMSIEKARRNLRFNPRSLEDGMKETYAWYSRTHPFGKPSFRFDSLVESA